MRILAVLTYYLPHWTGLTTHAARVAEGLAARGHDVTVVTVRHDRRLPAVERVCGVSVRRVPAVGRLSRGMVAPTLLPVAAALAGRHDLVVAHLPLAEAGPLALLCRARQTPLVSVHHGDLIMPRGLGNQVVERSVTASMLVAARLSHAVVAYSDDYADHSDFLSHCRARTVSIPPPVRLPRPNPDAAGAWRSGLRLDGRPVIGFAGRFVEEKGADLLLRALPAIAAQRPDAHVVFAGDEHVVYERFFKRCGPLIDAVRDRWRSVGLLRDRQQIADFYAMCDVLAVPSRSDCFAAVQVEAMLSGTPVVATEVPGAREVVRRTGMGRLVRPEHPPALAAGVLEVLRHRNRYLRPREAIENAFDAEQSIDRYEALLSSVHADRGHAARRTGAEGASTTSCRHAGAATLAVHRQQADGEQLRPRLSPADRQALEAVLRNESDMAFRRRIVWLVEALDLRHGDRVLDAGCGHGFQARVLRALRDVAVVGVDLDPDRLAAARHVAPGTPLVTSDLARLPFGDGRFTKVLLSEVLEHLPDPVGALREVRRVLAPGGAVAISVPHERYPLTWDPINAAWTRIGGRPFRSGPLVGIWTHHERLYSPSRLRDHVEAAGLVVESLDEATHYSVPFAHFLVYGVGKPLVERKLLPARLLAAADRHAPAPTDGHAGWSNPVRIAQAALRWVDRLNERPSAARATTFVNVLALARRPADVAIVGND
jgi:glycosyltransferase involved in cell wall biosynthesis/SAM-dependent methyltransferase